MNKLFIMTSIKCKFIFVIPQQKHLTKSIKHEKSLKSERNENIFLFNNI